MIAGRAALDTRRRIEQDSACRLQQPRIAEFASIAAECECRDGFTFMPTISWSRHRTRVEVTVGLGHGSSQPRNAVCAHETGDPGTVAIRRAAAAGPASAQGDRRAGPGVLRTADAGRSGRVLPTSAEGDPGACAVSSSRRASTIVISAGSTDRRPIEGGAAAPRDRERL